MEKESLLGNKKQALARVRVTVEVQVGPWTDDARLESVFDTAAREGVEKVYGLVRGGGGVVVGVPQVMAVLTEKTM